MEKHKWNLDSKRPCKTFIQNSRNQILRIRIIRSFISPYITSFFNHHRHNYTRLIENIKKGDNSISFLRKIKRSSIIFPRFTLKINSLRQTKFKWKGNETKRNLYIKHKKNNEREASRERDRTAGPWR